MMIPRRHPEGSSLSTGGRRRGAALFPVVCSLVGLGLSVAAILMLWLRGGRLPGKGLGAYDLKSPEGAIRAEFEMEANGDVRADLELLRARALHLEKHEDLVHAVQTFQCDRTEEIGGKVAVFYQYENKRRKRTDYHVSCVEKKDDGRYYPAAPPDLSGDDEREKKLRDEIAAWRRKGTGEGDRPALKLQPPVTERPPAPAPRRRPGTQPVAPAPADTRERTSP